MSADSEYNYKIMLYIVTYFLSQMDWTAVAFKVRGHEFSIVYKRSIFNIADSISKSDVDITVCHMTDRTRDLSSIRYRS